MYKVFTDNISESFQLYSEDELLKKFSDHKLIEAAGGIVRRGDQFLFIKRHGLWDIPKGKLDKGESPDRGGIREIEEETGLVAPKIIQKLNDTWHTYISRKGNKILKKTYWYYLEDTHPTQELIPQEEESITEVRFFHPNEFEQIRSNTYGSIIEVIGALEKII